MNDEITLLPCAHCGSPAQFAENENEGLHGMEYIECTNPLCGMATLMMQPIGESVQEKLAEIWNARAPSDAVEACERIMDAIAGHTDWHPQPHVDTRDWNEDAHIEVTITVADCRALKRVLESTGRIEQYL